MIPEQMKLGARYNWINQPDRLVYLGRNWSGNGYWHQFSKIGDSRPVWCEVTDADLRIIEETSDPAPVVPSKDQVELWKRATLDGVSVRNAWELHPALDRFAAMAYAAGHDTAPRDVSALVALVREMCAVSVPVAEDDPCADDFYEVRIRLAAALDNYDKG